MRVGVTGSAGLIGSALVRALEADGHAVVGLDLRTGGDVRDDVTALADCDGIVHLAAVSRVVWAERDPESAWATNVGGTANVCELAADRGMWVLFASSREVYGQPASLPVREDAPLAPLNVYARTKVEGERLVRDLPRGAVVRFSNVYGATDDHADRVIPAFVRAALAGGTLVVEGRAHTFDFVWIDDAVRGILALVRRMSDGEVPAPVHLVTGVGTTLLDLAERVVAITDAGRIADGPPRTFDVSRFQGDPSRAASLLGWRAEVGLEEGLRRLIRAHRDQSGGPRS